MEKRSSSFGLKAHPRDCDEAARAIAFVVGAAEDHRKDRPRERHPEARWSTSSLFRELGCRCGEKENGGMYNSTSPTSRLINRSAIPYKSLAAFRVSISSTPKYVFPAGNSALVTSPAHLCNAQSQHLEALFSSVSLTSGLVGECVGGLGM